MSLSNETIESIAIVIPTLNPDAEILKLTALLREKLTNPIIVINDGSKTECAGFFTELAKVSNLEILVHAVNLGKGRALKTAFNHYLNRFPNGLGCVTVDGDGQHAVPDIIKCVETLAAHPDQLVLGTRDFSEPAVPFKSKFGNNLTKFVFRSLMNCKINDTQTGLRGIGSKFMRELMNVRGERFEFETEMLLAAKPNGVKFNEVKIQTIYLDQNRATHFNPIKDSFKIYRVIFQRAILQFFAFSGSAVASAIIDLSLFKLFLLILPFEYGCSLRWSAIIFARIISAICNYLMNRNIVFERTDGYFDKTSFTKYALLCVFILGCSLGLTELGVRLLPQVDIFWLKLTADTICFIGSYLIQKLEIFDRK